MKYDPIKEQLFTDKGLLIKRLHCPIKMQWNKLKSNDLNKKNKLCEHCDRLVIDTSYYSDNKLYNMAQDNPNLCLKIDLKHNNIKLIAGGKHER